MLTDLAGARARLLAPGSKTPIERAADAATALLSQFPVRYQAGSNKLPGRPFRANLPR